MLLTKEEIEKAVKQGVEVKKKYPEFYKMHELIVSLNVNLNPEWFIKAKQDLINKKMEEEQNGGRKSK